MYPGSCKLKKIEASDFCGFSSTRGTFILPNCPEMMVKQVKNKVQAFQRSKTCPLVTKKWTNQESEPTSSREWHRKPYAESFITIRPQIAKLWPKMVSPWWPKNELIKKMTPPSVVDGKTVLTLNFVRFGQQTPELWPKRCPLVAKKWTLVKTDFTRSTGAQCQ